MRVISPSILADFVCRIFRAAGATEDVARLVADSLVASNLAGHDSHGVMRVNQYLNHIATGELDPSAEPIIVQDRVTIALVNAQRCFGQLAAQFAMKLTVERARFHGLSATGIFNCTHVGRLGEWVKMAADELLIGLAFCNGGRPGGVVAPYGGATRLLGTNPVAVAIPVARRPPLIIDFATSATAEGKLRLALNRGDSVPGGWILAADGRPSTNPEDFYLGGMLLPAAGHKGYGLSLAVEFLGGILTGHGSPGLLDFNGGNGVLFLALSIQHFRPQELFLEEVDALCEQLKMAEPASGFNEVLLPGEPEQRTAEQRRIDGIPIDENTWAQLTTAADELMVNIPNVG
jgi:LDH2 family malate/lactate/ureidoglycolate dehydrogenase